MDKFNHVNVLKWTLMDKKKKKGMKTNWNIFSYLILFPVIYLIINRSASLEMKTDLGANARGSLLTSGAVSAVRQCFRLLSAVRPGGERATQRCAAAAPGGAREPGFGHASPICSGLALSVVKFLFWSKILWRKIQSKTYICVHIYITAFVLTCPLKKKIRWKGGRQVLNIFRRNEIGSKEHSSYSPFSPSGGGWPCRNRRAQRIIRGQ